MIKINRADCPNCLQKSDTEFVKADYKRREVIEALYRMQHTKCCYCERLLSRLGTTERECEHYKPRRCFKDGNGNIQWNLANKWENLLYSCRSCNSKKGTQMPVNETTNEVEIIDPSYEDIDPEDHIDFVIDFPIISHKAKNGSEIGHSTIEKMKFRERTDLYCEMREKMLEIESTFADLINAIINNEEIKIAQIKNDLTRIMSANIPFAAFNRSFISKRIDKLNSEEIPKLEQQYGGDFGSIEIHFPTGYEVIT